MKKLIIITGIIFLAFVFYSCEKNLVEDPFNDIELKSGKSENKGFDKWGFNWNAHHFNGYLLNVFFADHMYVDSAFYKEALFTGNDEMYWDDEVLVGGGQDFINEIHANFPSYPYYFYYLVPNCRLEMHWNDELINKDGEYAENWVDTDAWITFKYSGTGENGKRWSQFQKMVAANQDDTFDNGKWYNKSGEEIGLFNDWDQLILIEVVNTGEPPFPFSFIPSYKNTKRLGFGITKK